MVTRKFIMNTVNLEVQGMSCGGCVQRVMKVLQPLQGVSGVDVDLPKSRVSVIGEFPHGSDMLVSALTAAGYPAKLSIAKTLTPGKRKSGGCCG
jgi:copper chaperone